MTFLIVLLVLFETQVKKKKEKTCFRAREKIYIDMQNNIENQKKYFSYQDFFLSDIYWKVKFCRQMKLQISKLVNDFV